MAEVDRAGRATVRIAETGSATLVHLSQRVNSGGHVDSRTLDKWNPDAIHEVFSAVTDHSETTRQTSRGLGEVMNSVPWEGEAYDAAAAASNGIQKDLDLHAEQLEAVANAAKTAETEVRGSSRIGRGSAGWQTVGGITAIN